MDSAPKKQTLFFSAKDGECHVFPLPIGLREWLKNLKSLALFVYEVGGWGQKQRKSEGENPPTHHSAKQQILIKDFEMCK